jgi:internalin A
VIAVIFLACVGALVDFVIVDLENPRVEYLEFNKVTLLHKKGSEIRVLSMKKGATDEDLEASLNGVTALDELNARLTRVTDVGLKHVKQLIGLKKLYLEQSLITDMGLEDLERLTGLTSLSLAHTQVTDTGLVHLKGLTSLTELYLGGTQVTLGRTYNLGLALPKC